MSAASGGAASTTGFSTAWNSGYEKVHVLRYLGARRMVTGTGRAMISVVLRVLAAGLLPLLLHLVLLLIAPRATVHGSPAVIWLIAFAVANMVMLVAALTAWVYVDQRSAWVDNMVADPVDRQAVATFLERRLSWQQQAPAPIILALVSIPFLAVTAGHMRPVVDVGVPSFVSLFLTMAIGANVVYWLLCSTPVMIHALRRPNLALRWHDPASTPALRLLADTCGLEAAFLLVTAIVVSTIGFAVPKAVTVPILLGVLITFYSLVVLLNIWVVLLSFVYVYSKNLSAVRQTLAVIHAALPDRADHLTNWTERDAALLELYGAIYRAPRLPFTTGTIVQYGAALLSTIVAFVLSLT